MAARAAADTDEPIGARLGRFAPVLGIDHIAEHQPAITVDRLDHLSRMSEAGDDQRHLVADHDLKIGLEARIGPVHDQIDAMGSDDRAGMLRLVAGEIGFNLSQPSIEDS